MLSIMYRTWGKCELTPIVFSNYLSFFRCVDDFKIVKTRFYWYFKYSLVSTLKTKLKYGSRHKVFQRYGFDIKCLDRWNNEVSFAKWDDIKKLKKEYLISDAIKNCSK